MIARWQTLCKPSSPVDIAVEPSMTSIRPEIEAWRRRSFSSADSRPVYTPILIPPSPNLFCNACFSWGTIFREKRSSSSTSSSASASWSSASAALSASALQTVRSDIPVKKLKMMTGLGLSCRHCATLSTIFGKRASARTDSTVNAESGRLLSNVSLCLAKSGLQSINSRSCCTSTPKSGTCRMPVE